MPIVVVCPCGAKLKAPDAAAGKRVKCPKCATALTVPAAEVSDFEMVEDDPPPVATPAKKKPMLVDDDDAPRPAKKPVASAARPKPAPVEVNEAVDGEEETPKKKRRRDDDDDDDTPKKKGKGKRGKKEKSNLPLILGIGGGVFVLLTVVGIIVGVMMSGGGGGQAQGTNTQPTTPPKPALPPGWSEFKGEGFSVAVPDAIQFKKQEQQGPNAGGPRPPADTQMYSNGVQPQPQPNGPPIFIYVVRVGKFPPAVAAEFAKSPEAGWEAVKKENAGGAKLQNEKVIQVAGAEGRQYTLNAGFVVGIVRFVVKGEKAYSWLVMSQAQPAEDAPEVKPFFDTFKIE